MTPRLIVPDITRIRPRPGPRPRRTSDGSPRQAGHEAPNTEMPQDRGSVAPRIHMVEAETPGIRGRQVQLTAQIAQALGAGIVLAR